jgi:Fic family protein
MRYFTLAFQNEITTVFRFPYFILRGCIMPDKAGTLKKQFSGEAAFFTFVPTPLQNIVLEGMGDSFDYLLVQVIHELAVMDTLSSDIPDMDLFISMYVRKEALVSSQIEGTQATLDDILDPEMEENANSHVGDVINYIHALRFAIDRMNTLPLCNRLLREAHAVLLADRRGGDKAPGEFRRSQNWIGGAGSTISTARYVPPSPEDMITALADLEQFINAGAEAGNPIVNAALIHYQFETIHPFLDGNGRVGRLLVLLYLLEKKVLSKPALYLSCFLKQNQVEYYDRLMEVRRTGAYEQWVRFFVQAVHEAAVDAVSTIRELTALRGQNTRKIATLGRAAKNAGRLYGYLEGSPIIELGKTAAELGLSYNTVAKAVDKLCALGILKQTTANARNRRFSYTEYLDILRRGT